MQHEAVPGVGTAGWRRVRAGGRDVPAGSQGWRGGAVPAGGSSRSPHAAVPGDGAPPAGTSAAVPAPAGGGAAHVGKHAAVGHPSAAGPWQRGLFEICPDHGSYSELDPNAVECMEIAQYQIVGSSQQGASLSESFPGWLEILSFLEAQEWMTWTKAACLGFFGPALVFPRL